jgi:hypothetical protein
MATWTDNFDDNVLDTTKWDKVFGQTVGYEGVPISGDVYERNQRLEFQTTEGANVAWNVGVVSKDRYNLTKGKVSVYLAQSSQYDGVVLLISPYKTTTGYIYTDVQAYYAIYLRYPYCWVIKRVEGGDVVELYAADWIAPENVLKIEVEEGVIRFYEGGVLRASDAYALPSYECYIYVYMWGPFGGWASPALLDWADDFYCEYTAVTEVPTWEETIGNMMNLIVTFMMMFMIISIMMSMMTAMTEMEE